MTTASAPPTRSRPGAAENLDPAECFVLLATQRLGRLAVAAEAGQGPHLVPVNYALVRGSITLRSVPGTKLDRILSQAVTFEVDSFDPFRRMGWSVVVEGLASEVPDREMEDEAVTFHPLLERSDSRWVRLAPLSVSGRRITTE
jgi:uncharacterized protein